VPNPCYGKTCANGTDCGEGCGCQDGKCVPCDSLTCDDCGTVLGCECRNGKCGKANGCSGNCGDSSDCGEGCTCHEGKCVSCKEFTCAECATKKGCACLNGKCQDDPNELVCADTFTLTKDNANCDLVAELTKEEECACNKVTVASKLAKAVKSGVNYKFDFNVELRKGSVSTANAVNTLSLLGDLTKGDIAENETPTSGVIELSVTPFHKEYDSQGRLIGISAGTKVVNTGSYSNVDSHLFSNLTIPKSGTKISNTVFVDRVEVEITHKTKFVHPNGCEYKGDIIAKYTFGASTDFDGLVQGTVNKDNYTKFVVLSSDKFRRPLITWYRSKDNNFTDNEIIRKLYVPKVSGKYTDTLRGMDKIAPKGKYPTVNKEGLLWSGYSYMVSTDCGCVKNAEHLNLVFCNPTSFDYEVANCNKTITLLAPFTPCDMNQDINIWKANDNFIPADAQAKYDLYFDGVKVETFKHDKNLGMVKDGTGDSMFGEYTSLTPITKISLKHNHDVNEECTIEYALPPIVSHNFTKEVNCDFQGSTYIAKFDKVGVDYVITGISGTGVTVVEYTNYFDVTLPKGISTSLTFLLNNGCEQVSVFNEDCCSSLTADLTITGGECGDPIFLNTAVNSGQPPYTYAYTKPNGQVQTGSNQLTLPTWQGGLYSVKVTDANGCIANDTQDISSQAIPTLLFSGYSNICAGSSTNLVINGNAATIGKTINYKLNTITQSFVMPNNGTYTISNITTDAVFDDFTVTVEGCTTGFDDIINISVISAPTATLSGTATICSGDTAVLSLVGTAGANVTISGGVGVKTIPSCGTVNCALTVNVTPTVDTTYTITNVALGSCTGSGSGSAVITVNESTPILKVSETCNSYTSKTLVFNHITTAKDQSNNSISITGGTTITVNPTTVNQVIVTYDNGNCIKTQTFNVTGCPCDIEGTLDLNILNSYCAAPLAQAGTVTLIGTGSGTAPYTYLWDTGETGTTSNYSVAVAGTYTKKVTVTDATGCSVEISKQYTVQPQPNVEMWYNLNGGGNTFGSNKTTIGSLSFDGTVVLSAQGATPSGGTFSWSAGSFGTGVGSTFSITATGSAFNERVTLTYTYNNCTSDAEFDISDNL
jgi:hypothetical protein